jgi:hypothetical protein
MDREKRSAELRLLAKSEAGRTRIQQLYKRALKIKAAPKPTRGKMLDMMIETILDHLYPPPNDLPREDESAAGALKKVVKCPGCGKVFIANVESKTDRKSNELKAARPGREVRCPKCSNRVRVDPK